MVDKGKLHFFRRNVNYVIGIRYFIGDNKGKALTGEDPFIAIEEDDLRDFKRANKYLLDEGLLIPTTEPVYDEESINAITDEKAADIVKNVFILKKTLPDITSESMLAKLLEAAKEGNRSKRTIDLIENRIKEVAKPDTMLGIVIKDGTKTYVSGTEEGDLKKAIRAR